MDERKVEALLRLLLLPVADRPDLANYDASFDRLELVGEFATLLDAPAELTEAFHRKIAVQRAVES